MRNPSSRMKKMFFVASSAFMVPVLANAVGDNGELNYFLAAIMAVPRGLEQWISCLFWFVLSLCFGYIIVALAVIAFSDINASKKKLYMRQVIILALGSAGLMITSIYFELYCLTFPFGFLFLLFVIIGVWYHIKVTEEPKNIEDDLEL